MTPLLVVLASLLQSGQAVDEFVSLARVGPDSTLVARIRDAPDDGREALRRLLARAAIDSVTDRPLAAAEHLAQAYTVAWRDSFLLRQVARFAAWSPLERQAKVEADSFRRAGNAALSRAGVATALRLWRQSLARCVALSDSAGMGAALGNIGAGFREAGALDSAERFLVRARTIAERIGDHRTAGNAVGMLAAVRMDRGDLSGAEHLYTIAAALRERTGDHGGAASDQNNLGLIAQTLGDWDGARRAFSGALALNRRAGRDEAAAANLTNLGNVASLAGEYVEAAARYDEALALYRRQGSRVDVALVLHNLGLLELARGDYRAALGRLVAALAIYRETGPVVEVIGVRRRLATVSAAMGDLQGALRQLSRAEHLAAGRDVPASLRAALDLSHADLATVFNALPEAERRYDQAGRAYRQIGDASGLAAAQQGAGMALLLQEEYPRAEAALELALLTEQRSGDARGAALVRLLLGYAQRHLGESAAARRTLTTALDTLRRLGDPVAAAAALGALGDLEGESGLTLAAESLYRSGLTQLDQRPAPSVLWQLHAGLGRALRSRGALAEAADAFGAAVAALERVSGTLPLEERRAAFLADKWDPYAQLALVEQARGLTASAFATSEHLRAREMLDLLSRGRLAPVAAGQMNAELVGREQDLRRRITGLSQALEGGHTAGGTLRGLVLDGPAADAAREALARAQDEYAALLREVRAARPEYAALVSGEIASPAELRSALAPDEALLEYLVSDSTTIAFIVTTDTLAAFDLNVGHHELVTLVDFVRGTLTPPRPGVAASLWRAPLRRLYQYLIAPVEASGLLVGKHALLIAPHAELHYVPFAALLAGRDTDRYLVERYRTTLIPSASVWLRLRARAAGPAPAGVLALAPRVDALPGSATEIAAIERIFGARARVLVGGAASESALRGLAPSQGIVHLATYGVLNKDNPLFSFVELAPKGDDDGRLEVHEVFELALKARLVALSACRTALGAGALDDVPEGDDWVGLVQAFLYAGASNVMATLWPVEDRPTAQFMERFYSALAAGQSEADALADAQRASLSNPGTAHPFYWAGFTMSGR